MFLILIGLGRNEKKEFIYKNNSFQIVSIKPSGGNDSIKKDLLSENSDGVNLKSEKKPRKKYSEVKNKYKENQIEPKSVDNNDIFSIGEKTEEDNSYFEKIIYLVNQNKRYPRISKINKESGVVKVSFTIEKDGKIVGTKVDCPCGHPRLNEAAVQAIKSIVNFDPIPIELNKEKINITIPVRFVLTEN